jgi:hypothetical protein
MSILPFPTGEPEVPSPPVMTPANDRCLLKLVGSEMALHDAMDIARRTIAGDRRQEVLELLSSALKANRDVIERYLAVSYPDRGLIVSGR